MDGCNGIQQTNVGEKTLPKFGTIHPRSTKEHFVLSVRCRPHRDPYDLGFPDNYDGVIKLRTVLTILTVVTAYEQTDTGGKLND